MKSEKQINQKAVESNEEAIAEFFVLAGNETYGIYSGFLFDMIGRFMDANGCNDNGTYTDDYIANTIFYAKLLNKLITSIKDPYVFEETRPLLSTGSKEAA